MIIELHHDSGSLKIDFHLWELIHMATDNGHLPPSMCQDLKAFVDHKEVERCKLPHDAHQEQRLDKIAAWAVARMDADSLRQMKEIIDLRLRVDPEVHESQEKN